MNERHEDHDYLFDPRGGGDREVEAIERLFAPLAHDGRALPANFPVAVAPRVVGRPRWLLSLLAAAVLAVSAWWSFRRADDDGPVELERGAAARTVAAQLAPRRVFAAGVFSAQLQPDGELRIDGFDEAIVALHLGRGVLRLAVDVPVTKDRPAVRLACTFATVEPVGFERCELRLEVDAQQAVLHVERGEVAVRSAARDFVVPAGATWSAGPQGPRWPLFDDCSDELRKAVARASAIEAKVGPERLGQLAADVVAAARAPRDTLVLWHLLQLGAAADEAGVELRLLELAGVPGKVPAKTWSRDAWLDHLRVTAWRSLK